MRTTLMRWARRGMAVLSAGVVLQASGCTTDSSELFVGLVSSVVTSTITNLVFGSFGLVA